LHLIYLSIPISLNIRENQSNQVQKKISGEILDSGFCNIMSKTIVNTEDAPRPVGPYSQAVRTGDMLFISGQIPIDPGDGKLVDGDVGEQAKRVMENIGAILRAAGLSFDNLVKTTIYLRSLGDFEIVNGIYAEYFGVAPPARACVEVSDLPKGAAVEIEAIAAYGND
jgi:2-iminobutanoate/2-iminopropanoate deaminase